jgi:uncharacterized protein YdeI (YjbR/CyaY-like superfamily)
VKARPTSFTTPAAFRRWLKRHHSSSTELLVRLRKVGASGTGMTYAEALDEALCVGWIDGVRKSIGAAGFTVRFTPRTSKSKWSAVNCRKFNALEAAGRIRAAGMKAFREHRATGVEYSYESGPKELSPAFTRTFRANLAAWKFFSTLPPSYRRTSSFWVMSAKREETRARRLGTLIDCSRQGRRIPQLARP